jgi:tRNA A37 threonylcarbamoyladenosine biosynthesis protein TsaE
MNQEQGIIENSLDQLLQAGRMAAEIHSVPAQPIFVIFKGPTGSGKTARIMAWAEENGISLIIENGATYPALYKYLTDGNSPELLYQDYYEKLNRTSDTFFFLDDYQFLPEILADFFDPIIRYLSIPSSDKSILKRIPHLLGAVAAETTGYIDRNK